MPVLIGEEENCRNSPHFTGIPVDFDGETQLFGEEENRRNSPHSTGIPVDFDGETQLLAQNPIQVRPTAVYSICGEFLGHMTRAYSINGEFLGCYPYTTDKETKVCSTHVERQISYLIH